MTESSDHKLDKSEISYHLLFDSNPFPMWIYDWDSLAFLEVNEAAIRRYGYSRAEFLGMTLKDICPSEDISSLMKAIRENHKTNFGFATVGVCRHRKKDGSIISVEVSCAPVFFKERNAGIAIAHDVTEHKQAEKEVQEKNIALKEVLSQMEIEKKALGERVTANVDKIIMPILKKLRRASTDGQFKYLELLEENLQKLIDSFGLSLSVNMQKLTPKEIEICTMIRSGMTTKEIADNLKLSALTIETHRNRIRKKLGISKQEVNLTTFLQRS